MSEIAFFITGAPRSGTKWLATLLNEAEGVRVYHEPLMRDARTLTEGHLASTREAVACLRERKERMPVPEGQRWGEVNHYLRHWVEPLRTVFPGVPIAGVIRDGKDTVNSLVHRGLYAPGDRRVLPTPPDEAVGQLAKCCWFWADTYERLLEQRVPVYRLECLNETRWTYILWLCVWLKIKPMPKETWKRYAGRPIHSSRLSIAREWTPARCAVFDKWAGDLQRQFYPL